MGYSLNRFLRPLKDSDKTIRVFDDRNLPTFTINPFSVLRSFVNNSNISIALTGNRTIVLDFSSHQESLDALVKFQQYVDILRQKAPQILSPDTERYIDSIAAPPSVNSLNGLTASGQSFIVLGDDNITGGISSSGTTHSISIGWTGMLSIDKGGTNNDIFVENELLVSDGNSVVSSGYSLDDTIESNTSIWSSNKVVDYVTTMTQKMVFNVGDGQNEMFTLEHNLGTRAVIVQIFDNSTGETVETEIVRNENSIAVSFANPPESDEYSVVIL